MAFRITDALNQSALGVSQVDCELDLLDGLHINLQMQ